MKAALVYSDAHESPECDRCFESRFCEICSQVASRFQIETIARSALSDSLEGFDIVFCAGGDGTLLGTAHFLHDTPLCGIRLFPERSVGFLCACDYSDIRAFIEAFLEGRIQPRAHLRLDCLVDGVSLGVPFLNDVLIAHRCPARASRYEIAFGGVSQRQCSSGVWVATSLGAHGGLHSAGGVMPGNPDCFAFCVRECARFSPQADPLKTAVFEPSQAPLTLKILGNDMCLFGDGGLFVRDLLYGQTLTFRRHSASLNLLGKMI